MKRAALLALLAASGAAAEANAPLFLAEGQVVTLEFARAVDQVAVSDLGVLSVKARGRSLEVTALRGGRTTLDVQFAGGEAVGYDVQVTGARRAGPAVAPDPNLVTLSVGEERRIPIPRAARMLLEENGVARARAEQGVIVLTGVARGTSSLVVFDAQGRQTTYPIRVR